ncbi:MAG: CoA transferase [Rhizobiaceae bacterium]|nr:CoA transferase [Rhizobiaceae bacterium]
MSEKIRTEQQAALAEQREPMGLSGLRVLDLGRYIAAPYCAALLADQGAEVIRIDPPGGAPDRDVMPIGIEGRGALYIQVNRNKKSVILDLEQADGRKAFERLVASADVVIVNLPDAALKRARLDYESLKAIRKDIILTTICALGFEGRDKNRIGFDGTGQALSGAMHLTGTGEQPMRAAVSYVDFSTAMAAAFATVTAIYERSRTGQGQHVKASLLGTALTMTNPMLIEEAAGARTREPLANRSPISGPSDLFRARDGWVMAQVIGDGMFARWARLVGREDLIGEERFASDIARGENGAELSAIMADWCAVRTVEECLSQLEAVRLPGCPVLTPGQALKADENMAGGFFRLDQSAGVPVAATTLRTAATMSLATRPAPSLGADTDQVLSALGYGAEEISQLSWSAKEQLHA